jgi:hypothetical protein
MMLSALGWVGTICVLVGRVFFVYDMPELAFITSVAGDLLWLAYGIKSRIWSLAVLDLVLLATDLIGSWTHPL